MPNPESPTLGSEIKRARLRLGTTLRTFATRVGVSAAHLSDIEHDRRHPSAELLQRIAGELKSVGVTFKALDLLESRLEPEIQDWVADTPEVRQMLRAVHASRRNPRDVLEELQRVLKTNKGKRS